MADDQEVKSGGETASEPSKTPNQTTSQEVDQTQDLGSDQSQETADEQTSSDGEALVKSERGQKRIQELANKANAAKELESENQKLREMVTPQEETEAVSQQNTLPPWMQYDPYKNLGGEITKDQLRQLVQSEARQMSQLEVERFKRQVKREQNFENDLSYLEKKYPELNEIQDKRLKKSLDIAKRNYQLALKANPDARLKDFVEPIMEARVGGQDLGRETASAKLAQQNQETAVKTSAQTKDSTSIEDLRKEMWKNPGRVAKILEEQLPSD